ncbi:MAG: DNRLRE domain-containing protein [Youngiibacter sp.]|nr:DNRLRE domain-containing protein [Youngiibacter sp.]
MGTITINANVDNNCLQDGPNSVYRTATSNTLRQTSTTARIMALNWNLSSIPANCRIISATLYLRLYSLESGAATIYAQRWLAAWGATTITWNNMPSAAGDGDSSVSTGTTLNVDVAVPVTNIVKAWYESGAGKYGIKVLSSTATIAYFRTQESAAPNNVYNPRLYVDYSEVPAFQVNVGDVWKQPSAMYVNISDAWRQVVQAYVNIGDVWREVK